MGLGLVNATGTDTIMAGLPREKAGIGSAVNDTARELGGTLGVAAMGSLFASLYSRTVAADLSPLPLPAEALKLCQGSVIAGMHVARATRDLMGPEGEKVIRAGLTHGFLDGFHAAAWLGAGFLALGALGCWLILPPHRQES
jgi:hypothetical protein